MALARHLGIFVFCLPASLKAQSPISIEQLLVKPSTWQIATSFDYAIATGEPFVSERQSGWSTGVRYGFSQRWEFNARFQTATLSQHVFDERFQQQTRSVSAGVNYLLKPEARGPALLLEARADLAADALGKRRSFPGGQLTLTTYKSIDPVVLSLTGSLQARRRYRSEAGEIQGALAWRLEPLVNFAVNPQVTLFGGASFARREALRVNGQTRGIAQQRIAMRAGIAYAAHRHHSIFFSGDVSSDAQLALNIQWFYEF
jgi:hypothetical protein